MLESVTALSSRCEKWSQDIEEEEVEKVEEEEVETFHYYDPANVTEKTEDV